jgi:hypothetical protein
MELAKSLKKAKQKAAKIAIKLMGSAPNAMGPESITRKTSLANAKAMIRIKINPKIKKRRRNDRDSFIKKVHLIN